MDINLSWMYRARVTSNYADALCSEYKIKPRDLDVLIAMHMMASQNGDMMYMKDIRKFMNNYIAPTSGWQLQMSIERMHELNMVWMITRQAITLTSIGKFTLKEIKEKVKWFHDKHLSNFIWELSQGHVTDGIIIRKKLRQKKNVTGVKRMKDGKYRAKTVVGRKHINIGYYDTIEEAIEARNQYINSLKTKKS